MNGLNGWEWLGAAFAATLVAAALAMPLAAAAWGIDAAAKRRIAPRWRCWLWTLVAVRLLLPFGPASSWSWHNIWLPSATAPQPQSLDAVSFSPDAPDAAAAAVTYQWRTAWGTGVPTPAPAAAAIDWSDLLIRVAIVIWAIGAVVVALRALVASRRFARRLRSTQQCADPRVAELLTRCCELVGVRTPRVKLVPDLAGPALFGAWRPTLCLPSDASAQLSDAELQMIFLHEAAHLRRGDAWRAWLVTAVQAVHWFNPVAWLATRRITATRELACDEIVRQFTEPGNRTCYAELLLRFARREPGLAMGLAGMAFARPGGPLAERITAWAANGTTRRVPATVVLALISALAIVGLTNAANTTARPDDKAALDEFLAAGKSKYDPLHNGLASPLPGAGDDGSAEPAVLHAYDVALAAAKLAEVNGERNPYGCVLAYAKLPGFGFKSARYDDAEPQKLWLETSPRGHAEFASLLASLARSGGWQVIVTAYSSSTTRLESLQGIDWRRAVHFTMPQDEEVLSAFDGFSADGQANELSVSSQSVSQTYLPYLAVVATAKQRDQILDQLQNDPRASLRSSPRVTMFSGTQAMICDRWQQPFVIGVHYVEGEYAAAAQPDVAMVSQGVRLDVNPQVIDAETLDLGCVATSSTVDEVGTVKIPGQDVTVQAPLVSRQSIAARCRLAPGEALLIAPLAGRQSDAAQPIDQELYVISAEWFLGSGFGGDVPVGKKAVIDEAVGAPRTEPADANKAASSSP